MGYHLGFKLEGANQTSLAILRKKGSESDVDAIDKNIMNVACRVLNKDDIAAIESDEGAELNNAFEVLDSEKREVVISFADYSSGSASNLVRVSVAIEALQAGFEQAEASSLQELNELFSVPNAALNNVVFGRDLIHTATLFERADYFARDEFECDLRAWQETLSADETASGEALSQDLLDLRNSMVEITDLNLSAYGLSSMPDVLSKIPLLLSLNLSGNCLTAAPKLDRMLMMLDLSNNPVRDFSHIMKPPATLYLQNCGLTELPKSLFANGDVDELYVEGNPITQWDIPEDLDLKLYLDPVPDLLELQAHYPNVQFFVSENNDEYLVESPPLENIISTNVEPRQLPTDETNPIDSTNIESNTLAQLIAKSHEYFTSSKFEDDLLEWKNSLPQTNLENAQAVLTQLIDKRGELSECRELDLSMKSLPYFPDIFDWMMCLQKVDLSDNCLSELPQFAKPLNELNLSNNKTLAHLGKLPNTEVKNLYLRGCGLEALPKEVVETVSIENLFLENNPLTDLFLGEAPRENLTIFFNSDAIDQEMLAQLAKKHPEVVFNYVVLDASLNLDIPGLELWLSRMGDTADASADSSSVHSQVRSYLTLAARDEQYKAALTRLIEDGNNDCGDRMSYSLVRADLAKQAVEIFKSLDELNKDINSEEDEGNKVWGADGTWRYTQGASDDQDSRLSALPAPPSSTKSVFHPLPPPEDDKAAGLKQGWKEGVQRVAANNQELAQKGAKALKFLKQGPFAHKILKDYALALGAQKFNEVEGEGGFGEDLEIFLKCALHCKETHGVICEMHHMLYERCAEMEESDLENARQTLGAALVDENKFMDFVIEKYRSQAQFNPVKEIMDRLLESFFEELPDHAQLYEELSETMDTDPYEIVVTKIQNQRATLFKEMIRVLGVAE